MTYVDMWVESIFLIDGDGPLRTAKSKLSFATGHGSTRGSRARLISRFVSGILCYGLLPMTQSIGSPIEGLRILSSGKQEVQGGVGARRNTLCL